MKVAELPWTPVKSSNLGRVAYLPETKQMFVSFDHADINPQFVWRYINVPPDVHAALLAAPSVGKFFHANIRIAMDESLDANRNYIKVYRYPSTKLAYDGELPDA